MMTSKMSNQSSDFTGVVNKDDIFIAVLGLAGSGKSSFITECTSQDATIGHGLASCTTTVSLYSYDHVDRIGKKCKVHLIDTPGFDDLERSDVEILQEVMFWLSYAYDNGFFLNGIVYLQSIAAPRWTAASQRSLEIFKALCGAQNYKSVVLATTFWDTIAEGDDEAQERYKSLVDVHWKDLKKAGSHIQPASYGYSWATLLIDRIVSKGTKHVLQVQSEMQIPGANLRDTTAGQTAGELWRLDDDRKEGVLDLDQTREQLLTHWSRKVQDDMTALTQQIEALRNQIGGNEQQQYRIMSPPPPYSHLGKGSEREQEEEKRLLRQKAKDLDRVKQVKLASYGMYVNTAAMVFGGTAAAVAVLSLLACNVM
ncbi:MAG: hypothetical protein Q9164_003027 [Protoblastenia rupestris]